MSQLQANWSYPSSIRTGAGRLKELPQVCLQLGMQAPLLVTDPGLVGRSMVQDALELCRGAGLQVELFSDVQGNPTLKNVEDGVFTYRAGKHDGVIAFGGGSALDAAKAVALMSGQDCSLWNFEDVGGSGKRIEGTEVAPIVALPTTAGTGSEVSRAAVITDKIKHRKRIIFHPDMLPAVVILDPKLTIGLPSDITAATGMDALSHNLEAFCSPLYHPIADGIAVEGIRLVKDYLGRAVEDGNDLEARTQMLVASSMGATAFQKGLGGTHALAHPLGGLYNAHHGLLNAILMPYVLQANRQAIEGRIERLARYLNLPNPGFDSFLRWVVELRDELGIPHSLASIDIDDSAAEKIGKMAAMDLSAGSNPILFDAQEYATIFKDAVRGRL
ncbi:iron-containing alcohol dehydrogenase [Amphritea sp. HPY]|uniref:iron-containing alcohol dehydrogenase n=1 Tax=Amphritea sp. HPY TaxID=3421652 RepID=UPI003D7D11C7